MQAAEKRSASQGLISNDDSGFLFKTERYKH